MGVSSLRWCAIGVALLASGCTRLGTDLAGQLLSGSHNGSETPTSVPKSPDAMRAHFDRATPACGVRVVPGGTMTAGLPLDVPGGIGAQIEVSLRGGAVDEVVGRSTVFSTERDRTDLVCSCDLVLPSAPAGVYQLVAKVTFRQHTGDGEFETRKELEGLLENVDVVVTFGATSHPLQHVAAATFDQVASGGSNVPLRTGATASQLFSNSSALTVGDFTGQMDRDTGSQVSAGLRDIFVHVQNADGSTVGWQTFGGAGDDRAHCVALSDNGAYWVGGSFEQTVSFGAGVGQTLSATGQGGFVGRFRSGVTERVGALDGTGMDAVTAMVAVPGSTDVIVAGTFTGGLPLPGGGTLTAPHGLFVMRLDADLQLVWAGMLGSAAPVTAPNSMELVGTSFVALAGTFDTSVEVYRGAATGGGRTLFQTLAGGATDGFLATFDVATGAAVSAEPLGGTGADAVHAIAVGTMTSSFTVVVGGAFTGVANVSLPGQSPALPDLVAQTTTARNGFIAGYVVSTGGVIQRAAWSLAMASEASEVRGLALESRGFGELAQHVLVTGDYRTNFVMAQGQPGETHMVTKTTSTFIAKVQMLGGILFYVDDWGRELDVRGIQCFSAFTNRLDHSYLLVGGYRATAFPFDLDCRGTRLPVLASEGKDAGAFFLRFAAEPGQ